MSLEKPKAGTRLLVQKVGGGTRRKMLRNFKADRGKFKDLSLNGSKGK